MTSNRYLTCAPTVPASIGSGSVHFLDTPTAVRVAHRPASTPVRPGRGGRCRTPVLARRPYATGSPTTPAIGRLVVTQVDPGAPRRAESISSIPVQSPSSPDRAPTVLRYKGGRGASNARGYWAIAAQALVGELAVTARPGAGRTDAGR